ncbi:MAG: HDIG domain-containing protein [Synergistaceae bacterium]|nr:HDIG domain-containing protein [Synergistaceae bacterium]
MIRKLYRAYGIPVLLLLLVGGAVVALQWLYASERYSFSEGKLSPRTYSVVTPMKYTDLGMTGTLKSAAEKAVAGVVIRDVGVLERMNERLDEFRNALLGGNKSGNKKEKEKEDASFSPELLEALRGLPEERREILLDFAGQTGRTYFQKVASADMPVPGQDSTELWAEINKLELSDEEQNLLYQVILTILDFHYRVDSQLTTMVRNVVGGAVPPVERRLEVGSVIVERGQMITPQIAILLRLQGYTEDAFPVVQLIVVALLLLILPMWLDISIGDVIYDRPSWGCIVFVFGLGWVCEAAASHLNTPGAGILASVMMAYLCMPCRMAFNVCMAGAASGVFLITGLSVYSTLLLVISSLLAPMAGYYALSKIESREHLVYRVFLLALLLALAKVPILWLQGYPITVETLRLSPLGETWRMCGRFLLFDLATTFLAISLLPMIEGYIGVFSVLRMRELSHPSSPLLRKLQVEAPGTYHHCLMIGTLAEVVAEELHINENLLKTGAYYHDIGKMRHPRFFVENQRGGENIHDTLSPTLSALAIIAHVRDGLEMAAEFGLPKKVKQFISEHHGTTSLAYFYRKAKAAGENVDIDQFRYPGPKPQSRETALLMLLDSSEAAMRAEGKKIQTILDIQEVIERVIALKQAEGQLDDVNLTFRELTRIKEALLRAFQSMYHTRRVKEIKENKDSKENQENRKEQAGKA